MNQLKTAKLITDTYMKALLMKEYKKLEYTDVPDPKLSGARDILVRIKAVAICGSDVHGFDGSTGRRKPPVIMGHEAAGIVEAAAAGVTKFNKGDRITFDSTIWCGECFFCRQGNVNLCDNRKVLGVSCDEYVKDGCFAELVVVPEHICVKLPDDLSFEDAALTEPATVAAHAVRLTPVALNETVAVVGAGLIGLLAIQILRASGCGRVIALDTDAARLKAALLAGACAHADPADADLLEKIAALTEGRGVDHVLEAVGACAPIKTAIAIARKGGTVTLIGNISPAIELPLQQVVTRQLRLQGSCAIAGEYPLVLDMMARKKIDVRSIISKIVPLSEGQTWLTKLYNREDNLLKIVMIP